MLLPRPHWMSDEQWAAYTTTPGWSLTLHFVTVVGALLAFAFVLALGACGSDKPRPPYVPVVPVVQGCGAGWTVNPAGRWHSVRPDGLFAGWQLRLSRVPCSASAA